jgi:hypothetical protein
MQTVPSTALAPSYPTEFSHMEAFEISILFMQRRGISHDLFTLFQTQIINNARRFLGVTRFYYPNARISDDKLVQRFPTRFCHVSVYSFLYLYLVYTKDHLVHTVSMTVGKHLRWYVKYLPSLIRNVELDCKAALLVVKCSTITEHTWQWIVGVRYDIVICVIQFA